MNIDNPKLIKQLESLVDNRQDWLFRFAYIRIRQREDAVDIVQEVLLPAFVLGMVMKTRHVESRGERMAASGITFLFMF